MNSQIKKINLNHSFIFFLFCNIFSIIALKISYFTISPLICLFLILSIGVSHGSLDNLKGRKLFQIYGINNFVFFYLSYILISLGVIFFWIIIPSISLIIFLIIASHHFGKEDTQFLIVKNSYYNQLLFFLKGSLIILAPLWLSFDETVLIFNTLGVKNQEFYNFLNYLNFNKLFLFLVLFSVLSNILISRELKYLTGFAWEIFCILALYDAFDPLVAFTIYFCFLHSLRHSASLTYEFNIGIDDFIKKAWPLTLLTAILFFVGIYILTGFQKVDIDSSIINVIFIGLASLTFPHILLEYIIEKNEKRT